MYYFYTARDCDKIKYVKNIFVSLSETFSEIYTI